MTICNKLLLNLIYDENKFILIKHSHSNRKQLITNNEFSCNSHLFQS